MLAEARQKLRDARAARPRPPRDDKVLTSWNGMMLSAFARGAQVFDEPRYLDAALASARFIESHLYDAGANVLKRRYRQGEASIDGLLEDYVLLIQGLLDLYEASFEIKWLSWAVRLQSRQDQLFWDAKGGAYFSTRAEASDVLVRVKEDYDGAEPSPNSVAAMNLLRLWQMTDRKDWRDKANATFKAQARPADSGRRDGASARGRAQFQPVQAEADRHRRGTGRRRHARHAQARPRSLHAEQDPAARRRRPRPGPARAVAAVHQVDGSTGREGHGLRVRGLRLQVADVGSSNRGAAAGRRRALESFQSSDLDDHRRKRKDRRAFIALHLCVAVTGI